MQRVAAYFCDINFNINPLNAELNPICHLLALLGAHHILHVSRIRVKVPVTPRSFKWYLHLDFTNKNL